MTPMVCCECGKRYDYDKHELCPRCGAFNLPGRDDHGHPVADHSSDSRSVPREEEKPRRARRIPVVVIVALVLVLIRAVMGVAGIVREQQSGPETVAQALGVPFRVSGKLITLSDPRWVQVPEELLAASVWADAGDSRFLVVDVQMSTLDPEQEHLAPFSVEIETASFGSSESTHFLQGDALEAWNDALGLKLVSLGDEIDGFLSGQLLYRLPADCGEEARLSVNEYGREAGSRVTVAEHVISLDLDTLPAQALAQAA